jgi:hypothetical protein
MSKVVFIFLSFLILVFSLHDIKAIPFYKTIGLDFSNNYGYHHCENSNDSIYKIDPRKCADFEARPYVYPPFLNFLFSWTKIFKSSESAFVFFLFLHIVSFLIVVYVWSEKNILSYLFSIGLFFTYPNLFLLERGNSDMFIVLFWSLAFFCYQKKLFKLAGCLIAISVFAKLYPVYSLLILAFYFLSKTFTRDQIFKSFLVTGVLIFIASPFLWYEYIVYVLPGWSGIKLPIFNLAHSLKSIPISGVGAGLFMISLLTWIIAARKSSEKFLVWVWSGSLAISTFNNGVSYDYNLVTLFPLSMVAFNNLSRLNGHYILKFVFLILFFISFGFRELLASFAPYPLMRLLLFGATLICIPFILFDVSHEIKKAWFQIKFFIAREV